MYRYGNQWSNFLGAAAVVRSRRVLAKGGRSRPLLPLKRRSSIFETVEVDPRIPMSWVGTTLHILLPLQTKWLMCLVDAFLGAPIVGMDEGMVRIVSLFAVILDRHPDAILYQIFLRVSTRDCC